MKNGSNSKSTDRFDAYVPHPRYGKKPILSGVIARVLPDEEFVRRSKCSAGSLIEETAILADMEKQKGSAYKVKYYFDEDKICIDCRRPFIFFALEQKYLYDELGFNINGGGRRFYDCRSLKRASKENNRRYAELQQHKTLTVDETIEKTDICLQEIEAGRFHQKQIETVQRLKNQLQREAKGQPHVKAAIADVEARLRELRHSF